MRRLRKDHNVKAAYKSVISEFIDQSTVELVTWETLAQMMVSSRVDLYFLPHRAVYDPGRVSTKCWVVMDASAKNGQRQIIKRLFVAWASIAAADCCSGATLPAKEGSINPGLQENVSAGFGSPR